MAKRYSNTQREETQHVNVQREDMRRERNFSIGHRVWTGLLVMCCLNFLMHLVLYWHLPEVIPVHWDMAGNVNGIGPRWVALILDALPFGVLALFRLVPHIDPKGEAYTKFRRLYRVYALVTVLFFVVLSWITEAVVYHVLPAGGFMPAAVLFFCGAGLAVLGNYLPRVRQNYSFGVKTPWALADEHCWQRTQRMGGITSIVMGVVLMVLAVLGLNEQFALLTPLVVAVPIGGIIWMYTYSYLVFIGKMQ